MSLVVTDPQTLPDAGDEAAEREAVELLCRPGVIQAVVQPIVRLVDMTVVGYESLARMPGGPPDAWLERAGRVGLRTELERACLAAAATLGDPPGGRLLFVNLSPSTLADPGSRHLADLLPGRLVVEVTEQEAIEDYVALRDRMAPWLAGRAGLARGGRPQRTTRRGPPVPVGRGARPPGSPSRRGRGPGHGRQDRLRAGGPGPVPPG